MLLEPVHLIDEAATERLGADIAMALVPGDLVCLSGEIGAGKSTLARALIRHLARDGELEVPSPTFTLCQRYELTPPVSHFDLYRLSNPGEMAELGFDEALASGAVLVEWPERAGCELPADALTIRLDSAPGGGRVAHFSGGGEGLLAERLHRSLALRRFLDAHWDAAVERRFLQGDASARRYETAHLAGETRIVMDSPRRPDGPAIRDGKPYSRIAHLAEDVVPFLAVAEALRAAGFAAPQIFARSLKEGFLLIEHLGQGRIVDENGVPIVGRYEDAARLLAAFHRHDWPRQVTTAGDGGEALVHVFPRYDRMALSIEASLLADWYAPRALGRRLDEGERAGFDGIWAELIGQVENSMPTLVMRDYHSPNIIWRGGEAFPQRLGLIDFQDAVIGPQAYDLASLAQDARVDIPPSLERALIEAYLAERRGAAQFDEAAFLRDYAILAAQRASKILGIFVRLDERDGKPAYLAHLPRMRDYLRRSLAHPALARYRAWCEATIGIAAGETPVIGA